MRIGIPKPFVCQHPRESAPCSTPAPPRTSGSTPIAHDDFDSPFEQQVYKALRARGYAVHTQVGCSGYRIDLAVVDPEAPGRYLLGIECDGANYHRAKTARDRDRLRETILRGLGW